MKVSKKKKNKKKINFFKVNYNFHEPFRVLVDGTFIEHARKKKLSISENLQKLLNGKVIPVVSNCVMTELRQFGIQLIESTVIAKQLYRQKCFHKKSNENHNESNQSLHNNSNEEQNECDKNMNPLLNIISSKVESSQAVSAADCILSLIGENNPHKYFVATQDPSLKGKLMKIPGVPVVLVGQFNFVFDEPSRASHIRRSQNEIQKMNPSKWEMTHLPSLIQKTNIKNNLKNRSTRKKKGKNPLSCLKSKKKKNVSN